MSKENARQEVKPQTIVATSPILIDSAALGKKDWLHILHVDDDVCFLEVSKQILSIENNFEIDTATSVGEAFKKMETQTYNAIVSDYEMPLKNGLDFLRELREQRNEIPFILFTGKGREEVVVKALNLGADRYINKNGSPETVYCELAYAINETAERKKSGELLAKSESKYRVLVEKSLQGILITLAAPLRLVFANEAMGKILGYSPQELMSLSSEEIVGLVHHEDRAVFFKRLENRFRGEPPEPRLEFRAVRKDRSIIWLDALANRVEYDGQWAVQGLFLDINERKKAEKALMESETKFRMYVENSPVAVFVADSEGKYEYVNEAAAKLLGYSANELLRMFIPQIVFKEEHPTLNGFAVLQETGKILMEARLKKKDGQAVYVSLNAVKLPDGKLIAFCENITERKKAEKSLKESEEKFRNLAEESPNMIFINKRGRVVYANKKCENLTGFTREEFYSPNFNFLSLCVPEYVEVMRSSYTRHMRDEPVLPYEYALVTRDNKRIEAIITTKLMEYEGEKAILGIVTDITEHKKMVAALRQDQDMLEAITDNLGAGFVTISKDYRVLYANKFVRNNCGNVEGKQCYATLNTLDHVCPDCGVKKIFEGGVTRDSHEYSQMGIDGKPYYVELIATPLKDKDGNVTAALEFVVDIAEKKRMQQKLQANEAKFRAISDSAIDAIFMFNEEDTVTYWNPAAERIFGYTGKEIIGQKVGTTIVPPRYREDNLGLTTKLAKGENENIEGEILEFRALRKDKTEFLMELSITSLQLIGKQHFVAIARDITERKKAEEALHRSMEELVLVNEKLNVVGSLTRHDVRNKLFAMTGNAFLLKKKHPDQADVIDGLGKMEQACKEIVAILDFAKMYEQLGVEELTYIDVEKTLNEALTLFSGSLTLKVINDCHGLTLLADSFLRQLFFNLIDNSVKHGKKATTTMATYEKVDQDRLNLIYEDDGIGIPVVNKPQLFKEGFSTGGSSGYGLYLIRKMIEIYGWAIQENGESDKGAKFVITIPRLNQKGKEIFQIAR